MNVRFAQVGVALALAGCGIAASDHEQLGDQAFRERRFARALSEYQAAQRNGARSRVWAKAAAAAIEAQDYGAAIDGLTSLATEDRTRASEAAVGLERVARLAERQGGDGLGVVFRAVLAIRAVAPNRPIGRLALMAAQGAGTTGEGVGLIPTAIANAGTARAVDSLLLQYADAQRTTVACDGAARSYQTVLRRTEEARIRNPAREGLAECALLLGGDALATQDGRRAEQWFTTVLGFETDSPRGWQANLGLGDARLLQGDALGAAVAYQAVVSAPGVPDSLRVAATTKLNGLGAATAQPPADGDQ